MMRALILLSLLLSMVPLHAAEYDKNPDHLPSITLTLGRANETGEQDFIFEGAKFDSTDLSGDLTEISGLFKFPISNTVTLVGGLALWNKSFENDETYFIYGSDGDVSGWMARVGFTKYFGR